MFFNPTEVNFLDEELPNALSLEAGGTIGKYLEGYNVGLTWPDAWDKHGEPGGPWVYLDRGCYDCGNSRTGRGAGRDRRTSPRFTCKEARAFSAQSQAENRAWRDGWKRGYAEKKRTGRSNPMPNGRCGCGVCVWCKKVMP